MTDILSGLGANAPTPLPATLADVLIASRSAATTASEQAALAIGAKDDVFGARGAVADNVALAAQHLADVIEVQGAINDAKDVVLAAHTQVAQDKSDVQGLVAQAAGHESDALAAVDIASSARDLASGYKNTTQTLLDSVSAAALTVSGYATSAAASAASASAVSGLSNMSAAAKAIVTAADVTAVYIYDTTRDTDGGAWGDKCADKSWMIEALNTATRGATARRPQRMLIVGQSTGPKISIYDFSDPACPHWLSVNGGVLTYGVAVSAIYALNGAVYIGGSNGLSIFDFIADDIRFVQAGNHRINGNIASRSLAQLVPTTGGFIAHNTINSIGGAVLPTTQPNPLRGGLPNPTVGVGTGGALSIIRADGVIVNSAATGGYTTVSFTNDFTLVASQGPSETDIYPFPKYLSPSFAIGSDFVAASTIPAISAPGKASAAGSKIAFALNAGTGLALMARNNASPANSLTAFINDKSNTGWLHGATKCALAESNGDLSNLSGGELVTNGVNPTSTAGWTGWTGSEVITAPSNKLRVARGGAESYPLAVTTLTGLTIGARYVMRASIESVQSTAGLIFYLGCTGLQLLTGSYTTMSAPSLKTVSFVAPSTAVQIYVGIYGSTGVAGDYIEFNNISVRLAASDKSGSNLHALAYGSLTRSVVAAGAELAAYGGFSASNYLEVQANAALDFGTGDFCAMAWVNPWNGGGYQPVFCYGTGSGAASGWGCIVNASGAPAMTIAANASGYGLAAPVGQYNFYVWQRRAGVLEIYTNGVRGVSQSGMTGNVSLTGAVLQIGNFAATSGPWAAATVSSHIAGLAIPRPVTAGSFTPDQIAAIYADELKRFQPNAKDLLAGSSNVQGVSYDPDTDRLAIATAAGTNLFKGLVRVGLVNVAGVNDYAKLSSDNHKAVSFAGGDLVIASAAQVYGSLLATSGLREIAKRRANIPAYDPTWAIIPGLNTANATATDGIIGLCPEGHKVDFVIESACEASGFASYGGWTTRGTIKRPIGGTATVDAVTTRNYPASTTMSVSAAVTSAGDALKMIDTGLASTPLTWTHTVTLWRDSQYAQAA